jgi:uncharacterized delta-60 repeat protein
MKRLLELVMLSLVVGLWFCATLSAQVSEEWISSFNGKSYGLDEHANAMTTDVAGNVYVTGALQSPDGSVNNCVTIKYDQFGSEVWKAKFAGTNGQAIAVDGAGNVYVAASKVITANFDFFLIKYSIDGDTIWTRSANGPRNATDIVRCMVINGSGNICLAGASSSSTFAEMLMVLFDPDGNQLAINSYTSGEGNYHGVNAMTTDASGNVYITGYKNIMNVTGTTDVMTLKYNAFGSLMWGKAFDGLTKDYDSGNDIAVDLSGNVYVTGVSNLGSTMNTLTIKYSPVGDTVWSKMFSRGIEAAQSTAIAVDASGNAIIAGKVAHYPNDIFVQKYNTNGDTLWTRYFSGKSSDDVAKSIAIDLAGNVYIGGNVGSEIAILKYSASGKLLWNQSYKSTINGTNNLISSKTSPSGITTFTETIKLSASDNDIATVQFDSSGGFNWESIFQEFGHGFTRGVRCVVGPNGNLYVAGYGTFGVRAPIELITIKYTSAGDTLWIRRYDAGGGEPMALVVDKRDNVYIASFSYNLSGNPDFLILKYDRNGILKWTVTYDNGSFDFPNAIAVDDNGSVYITGESTGNGGSDYVTLKYDSSGAQQWFPKRYNPSGGDKYDRAFAITLDKSGNVYVTGGACLRSTDFYTDIATIKYNSAGVQQWVKSYRGTVMSAGVNVSSAQGTTIAADDSGNVYVGGTVDDGTENGGKNMIVIKYTTAGDTVWTGRYNSPANATDIVHALALDRQGNVIVTGASANGGPTYDYDYSTVKFNPQGIVEWGVQYDDGYNGEESATAIAVDTEGNTYVTGSGSVPSDDYQLMMTTFNDITTIRYSPTGTEDWSYIYNGTANSWDQGRDLALDPAGNVYITGVSQELENDFGDITQAIIAIKFHQGPVSVKNHEEFRGIPKEFALNQNYPNPFNPTTTIGYTLPSSCSVRLTVFNVLGQVVNELLNEEQTTGWHQATWNPHVASGLYFYRIEATSLKDPSIRFSETKKMLLLR